MKAIGIDIGTTGIGGVLFDVEKKQVEKSITQNSNAFIQTENSWEKIQDVEKIISIAKSILDQLLDEQVCVIGVTGQMHGIVYYDKNGNAVSPLYTWQDGRGNLKHNDKTYAETLGSFSGYGCVTDFYNKTNRLVNENAVGFCTIADYFTMKICGRETPLVHVTNGASLGCYSLENKKFTYNVNFDMTEDFKVMGEYKGVPVSVAIGDNQASVLSSCKEKDLLINVGTGSQVSVITDNILFLDSVETRPYFEGKFLTVGSALCGGRAYSLIKDFFLEILSWKTEITESEVYSLMNKAIKEVKAPTVKCDTRFAGTRADKNVSGSFYNVTTDNFKPKEFLYAVLQGMVTELYSLYSITGEKRTSIVATGNGVRKNEQLVKIAEETFLAKIKIPTHTEEASFGAILFALISIGKFKSVSQAQTLIEYLR